MRLAQLGRKLSIRPSEIVNFLASRNIVIDEKSNIRLDEDQIRLILEEFEPQSHLKSTIDIATPEQPPVVAQDSEPKEPEPKEPEPTLVVQQEEVKGEVIKAPKVELSGLKVLGKIELPEPKKKVTPESETPVENQAAPEKNTTRRPAPVRRDTRQPRKNPIALQRERDEMEMQQKKEARVQEDKEKRTKNYQNRIKVSAPTKRIKLVEEQTEEMTEEPRSQPKTLLGRFFRWLSS